MEILTNILLWLHIIALVVGGSNSVAMPLIGSKMAGATPETMATLFAIGNRLSSLGKGAMAVLLVSGPLMMWTEYGWAIPNFWFWVKMVLVAVMLVTISLSGINFKKAQKGDVEAARKSEQFGKITAIAFLGVLLSAVFAFA